MGSPIEKTPRPTASNCILVRDFRGERLAQQNVYAVLGRRAAALFHEYVSTNLDEDFKQRRAFQFRSIAGFHPQEIVDLLQLAN